MVVGHEWSAILGQRRCQLMDKVGWQRHIGDVFRFEIPPFFAIANE